nr:MAG TPA: hypothetical protein [Caudoviricetes sp.]
MRGAFPHLHYTILSIQIKEKESKINLSFHK